MFGFGKRAIRTRLQRQVVQGNRQGEVLAQGIPPKMSFPRELRDVLRSRASSAGFEQTATREEGDDGQHLR